MTAALVVASGRTDSKTNLKPSQMVGSITVAERILILLRQAGIQHIVVVCDENDKMKRLRSYANLTFLSAVPEGSILDNIKIGLSYLQKKCTEVLIVYVDIPLFSIRTIHSLMAAEGDVCIPSYHGQWGHPLLIRHDHFAEILSYHGENGLQGAIESADIQRHIVDVEDAGIRTDIQRSPSYEALLSNHDASRLRLSCTFSIGRERLFYDENVHRLLQLTEEMGSLSKACSYMGISLNKGRAVIATIQQQLGCPILETQQGGKHGGYSHITPQMQSMMQAYASFRSEADETLQALFKAHFSSQIDEK